MQKQSTYLIFLISAACCSGRIVEWPVTLQFDIKSSADDEVTRRRSLPPVDPPFHSAGLLELNNTVDARLFFFYAQDRNKNPDAPLILWTNGGPGCSSTSAAFAGLGPFDIQKGPSLKWSTYGWDLGQNVIFLDQPVGTGFSDTTDKRDYVRHEDRVGQDGLTFLLEFMEIHPELHGKELFLAGVSYAGHFLPAIAHAIQESNKQGKFRHLNLKGVLLGNPAISEIYLQAYYPFYAVKNGLISKKTAAKAYKHLEACEAKSVKCNQTLRRRACVSGFNFCTNHLLAPILDANPDLNVYDIRVRCAGDTCSGGGKSLVSKYLNLPRVQAQLGVDRKWKDCNNRVFKGMLGDQLIDSAPTLMSLLNEGIRFLIYSGDQDLIVNWIATQKLLSDLPWKRSDEWKDKFKPWRIEIGGKEEVVGECETVEPLTNCRIFQAGHSVDSDLPFVGFSALQTFIHGRSFVTPDPTVALKRSDQGAKDFLAATW